MLCGGGYWFIVFITNIVSIIVSIIVGIVILFGRHLLYKGFDLNWLIRNVLFGGLRGGLVEVLEERIHRRRRVESVVAVIGLLGH